MRHSSLGTSGETAGPLSATLDLSPQKTCLISQTSAGSTEAFPSYGCISDKSSRKGSQVPGTFMWWSPDIPQDLRGQHGVHILGRLLGEMVHGLTSLALTLQLEGSLAKTLSHTFSALWSSIVSTLPPGQHFLQPPASSSPGQAYSLGG